MHDWESNSAPFANFCFGCLASEESKFLQKEIHKLGGTTRIAAHGWSTEPTSECSRLARDTVSQFANQLLVGEFDLVVFVTAAGFDYFLQQSSRLVAQDRLINSLKDILTVAGSPAASAALEHYGIRPEISLRQPQTWRDLLVAMDRNLRVTNFIVGLEECEAIHGLAAGIEARGGRVWPLPIYPQPPLDDQPAALAFLDALAQRQCQALLLMKPGDVQCLNAMAKQVDWHLKLNRAMDDLIVIVSGAMTKELCDDHRFPVDYVSDATDLQQFLREVATVISDIEGQKQKIQAHFGSPGISGLNRAAPWYDSLFMKACRGEPTERTPIWLMGQSGQGGPDSRSMRTNPEFRNFFSNPQRCSELACSAVNRLNVDAAELVGDPMCLLVPLGVELDYEADEPVIDRPIRTASDVQRIRRLENLDQLAGVLETVQQTRRDLQEDIPLIGFSSAPFSLASVMIEGDHGLLAANTKRLMYLDQGAWHELMQHLSHSIAVFLNGQIAAGVQAVQLLDFRADELAAEDYNQFVQPYVQQIINSIPRQVPIIHFVSGSSNLLSRLAESRATVIGIDWRVRLDQAWSMIGHGRSIQGNLDPAVLLTDQREIRRHVKRIVDQVQGRAGHIFNLGHWLLPQTPFENIVSVVEAVQNFSQH